MKTIASEQQEIRIRKNIVQWQRQQATTGIAFHLLCLLSVLALIAFFLNPSAGAGWFLLLSLMLMVYSGGSMIRSAHAVVQHKQMLPEPTFPESWSDESPVSDPPFPTAALTAVDAQVVSPTFTRPVWVDGFVLRRLDG